MTWLFHKMIVLQIIKAPSHSLTRPFLDAFGLLDSSAGPVPLSPIIKHRRVLFLVMTGQALLMSPKDQTRPGMDSSNYGKGFLLFAILSLCEITT